MYNIGNAVGSNTLMNKGYHGYIAGHLKTSGVLTGEGARTYYKYGNRGVIKNSQNSFKNTFNGENKSNGVISEMANVESMLDNKFENINKHQYIGIKTEELPNLENQLCKNYYKLNGGRSSYYLDGAKGYTGETYSNITTNTVSNNTK